MNKLIIIGASGHGKVVADIARLNGYDEIVFLDDNEKIKSCLGYPVIGRSKNAPDGELFVAIGDADVRERLSNYYYDREQPILIHPSAVIADGVKIGRGTVIMAGSVVNSDTSIGRCCIINTCSSVDHDCKIEEFAHVSVGAHISGTVEIGKKTWIGAGAVVTNNINICSGCMIGAGAVVVRNLETPGIYIGVPAKIKRENGGFIS